MSLVERTGEQNGVAHGLPWSPPPGDPWSAEAPGRLRKRYPRRGDEAGWRRWQKHLAGRGPGRSLTRKAGKRDTTPLRWALGDGGRQVASAAADALIERLWRIERGSILEKRAEKRAGGDESSPSLAELLRQWIAGEPTPVDVDYALESLAWARALPALAATLDEAAWWSAWDKLVDLSRPGDVLSSDAGDADALADQLLTTELPLTLAWLLPELAPAPLLALAGWRAAERGLERLVSKDGFLPAALWNVYRPLLACWTRSWSIVEALRRDGAARRAVGKLVANERARSSDAGSASAAASDSQLSAGAELPADGASDADAKPRRSKARRQLQTLQRPERYERLLATTLRLCRADGGQLLSGDAAGRWDRAMFSAARRLVRGAPVAKAVRAAKPSKKTNKKPSGSLRTDKRRRKRALWPAARSEQAQSAVLRGAWRHDAPRLAVTYSGGVTRLELEAAGRPLLSGVWSLDLARDGEPIPAVTRWKELCWVSDADADYLELEAKFPGDLKVQRQILLARRERILVLADCVIAAAPAKFEYASTLPLAPGRSFRPAEETVEGWLTDFASAPAGSSRKPSDAAPRVLALPLALPEWRSAFRAGELTAVDGALRLEQRATGRGIFAPLLFDLDPRRARKPFTWRRLTVGEGLRPLADDVAVGYRAQVGERQWLVFRSLAPRSPRTVLGQHLSSEFMVGSFEASGEVHRLLEVESE